ncbi:hypothetical protein P691DRAFT_787120 [Macrolepiota fuliginosa MF-IS2]|uniref:Secreted protein n=1 Tax=Macrolepiota fuliginosa MF-IS2 TaxID=1400762 RepID=A0A9P5XL03_9AGAR|nr:hypothetical protein P691DRAFT_787120 [Macrolepiota fuliginosa MF-IS2]
MRPSFAFATAILLTAQVALAKYGAPPPPPIPADHAAACLHVCWEHHHKCGEGWSPYQYGYCWTCCKDPEPKPSFWKALVVLKLYSRLKRSSHNSQVVGPFGTGVTSGNWMEEIGLPKESVSADACALYLKVEQQDGRVRWWLRRDTQCTSLRVKIIIQE